MALSEQKQQTLDHIWHDLHEAGKSEEALEVARETYREAPRDEEWPEYEKQLALQIVALAKANLKTSDSLAAFGEGLVVSADQALHSFPFASTPEKARKQGDAWQGVFDKVSGPYETLRHMVELVEIFAEITQDPQLYGFAAVLFATLQEAKNDTNRAGLIADIERGTYVQAKDAFEKFVLAYGPEGDQVSQPTESLVVASKYLGRNLLEGDLSESAHTIWTLAQITAKAPAALQVLGAMASSWNAAHQLYTRIEMWRSDRFIHQVARDRAWKMKELRYFGAGQGKVIDLKAKPTS